MFEKASKLKLRFTTKKGQITVEDLWDLPLTSNLGVNLDDIAKGLNKSVKEAEEESFVVKKSRSNTVLELQFDIVKHVIKVKLDEAAAAKLKAENKAKKDKILNILADKEDEELKESSKKQLKKMLSELD